MNKNRMYKVGDIVDELVNGEGIICSEYVDGVMNIFVVADEEQVSQISIPTGGACNAFVTLDSVICFTVELGCAGWVPYSFNPHFFESFTPKYFENGKGMFINFFIVDGKCGKIIQSAGYMLDTIFSNALMREMEELYKKPYNEELSFEEAKYILENDYGERIAKNSPKYYASESSIVRDSIIAF